MLKKISIILLSLMTFTGCSNNTAIMYTNLASSDTQQEITVILKDAGLPNQNIDQFLSYVVNFNNNAAPITSDWQEIKNEQVDYQSFEYKQVENPEQSDLDSLIPAFMLTKELISNNENANQEDSYLQHDLNLINSFDEYSLDPDDQLKFTTTFNTISVVGIKNNEISHINQIEKTFNDRDFEIKNNQSVSLVTLWLHVAQENIRYVSHSGVLIDKHNILYFIEKYDSFYPFQVTKFNNRSELKKYLLNRNDLKGDENDGQPLIFENNKYLNK